MSTNSTRKSSPKRLHQALIAATMWAVTHQAAALGLSEIDLQSGLHQPFKASIKLRNFDPIEMDRVSVEIANDLIQSQYSSSNYLPNQLRAEIKSSSSGTVIQLSSPTAVDEPFLKFAVQLNSPNGLILRQYEVLLDPPKNLFTPDPAPVGRQQIAKHAEPAAVKQLRESIRLSAKDRNSGIELATAPKTAALIKAPARSFEPQITPQTKSSPRSLRVAPMIRSALAAPAQLPVARPEETELPEVAALIDATQSQIQNRPAEPPKTDSVETLYSTSEMSEQDFIAALEEYSLANMLTPARKPKFAAKKVKLDKALIDPTISTFKPETAALSISPSEPDTIVTEKPAASRLSAGIPEGVTIGTKSTRFAVEDNDFAKSDADSVARALMQYREDARAGKKTSFHPSELIKMSADGVKRIQTPPN